MTEYNKKKAILMLLASAFSFATMSAIASFLTDVSAVEKMFFRSILVALITWMTMRARGEKFSIQKNCLKEHLMRGLFGLLGVLGNYYAVTHMLLSDANMIMEMSPFFVILLSALFLREKADGKQYACVVLALIGEAFVVKPSAEIFSNPTTLIVLGASISAGAAYMWVRALNLKGEKGSNTVMFFALFCVAGCLPFMLLNPPHLGMREVGLLALMSVFAYLGQITVTAAYKYAPSSEVSIFDYSQVIFSAIYGWILFRQIADGLSYLGYGIIILAALLMYLYNQRKAGRHPQA